LEFEVSLVLGPWSLVLSPQAIAFAAGARILFCGKIPETMPA
jgi:hypothetical protein